jgi:uncharacterized membrane protein YccC
MTAISATATKPTLLPFGSLAWFRRELAPTPGRARRTAIIVGSAVLCVIISMTLQVPELQLSAYMAFFVSKETKFLCKVSGVIAVVGLAIGVGASLLLYKFTYGYPELRIPGMAIALFLGMFLSRVFVLGPIGFLAGFILAISQSKGESVPSPELLVRGNLWLLVAWVYGVGVAVVLNLLFLPDTANPPAHRPRPKSLFVADAFTNPIYVHFALKVTLAGMFCYIFYSAIDWPGIYTSVVTCTFVALDSSGATLHKSVLRIYGCVIGGAMALFTIVFLMPHLVTIASLVVVVACASAIAAWVATGTERISYAGLQIAFAFFFAVFQGYAPDTDLDNVRDRVVGIVLGLIVTLVVFQYIWPERTIDHLRDTLRKTLQQLARLLDIPRPQTSIEAAKAEAQALMAQTATSFHQTRRYVELTRFEFEHYRDSDWASLGGLETTVSRAEDVFAGVNALASDQAWNEWQLLPLAAKTAESELRNVAAKRIERVITSDVVENTDTEVSRALDRWNATVQQLRLENSRTALISTIAAEVRHLG